MDSLLFRLNGVGYEIGVERREDNHIYFSIPFKLKDIIVPEIKDSFEDAEWMGFKTAEKLWRVPETQLNCFRLQFYFGLGKPYEWYDRVVNRLPAIPGRYDHQGLMTSVIYQFHQVLIGAEMGTGKTLATFDALRLLDEKDIWWVAPRSALYSLMLEQDKWKFPYPIKYLTYDGLRTTIDRWTPGDRPPRAVVFDESQRLKSDVAKRTKAAMHLADNMRIAYGRDAKVICLSGSPSPKSPVDLWSQARIACPGFLREGSSQAFKRRMSLTVEATNNITGTKYPKLVTWWDDEKKCGVCGQYENDQYHNMKHYIPNGPYHPYKKSVNEVEKLAGRLKGLMTVVLKRDVLKELPEKIYRVIECPPTQSTLRGASMITQMETRGSMALTRLREFSDGFQYEDVQTGTEECPLCKGSLVMMDSDYIGPQLDEFELPDPATHPHWFKQVLKPCGHCEGFGVIPKMTQTAKQIPTPKEKVLKDLLEQYEEEARVVVWGGFHGAIDRCLEIARKSEWHTICVDGRGRGWRTTLSNPDGTKLSPKEMLHRFQSGSREDRIAWIAHPGAGGTGVTLTASPVAIYYSNDFNFENRIQSEDRIHRLGMNTNKGATIIDLIHLPSDRYVLDNLLRKQKLQAISIGDLHTAMSIATPPNRGYGVHVIG